jgi:hypothetical protein
MKIIFIVPSLRFGLDGIADYTDRLSAYCAKEGHETAIVTLREGTALVSDSKGSRNRMALADATRSIRPDVISWQFDPRLFTSSPSRIFLRFLANPFPIKRATNIHVMIHETWDGAYVGAPWRTRLKGIGQKWSLLHWLSALKPNVVNTSNELYVWQLRRSGIDAKLLPLFSNILVCPSLTRDEHTAGEVHLIFFGPLFGDWDPAPLLDRLQGTGKQIVVHYVGHQSSSPVWQTLRESAPAFMFVDHGPLPAPEVSNLLSSCHFGVSTYPLALTEKSGAFAAMRDHGLPTLITRNDRFYVGFDHESRCPAGVIILSDLPTALCGSRRRAARDSLEIVGKQFLKYVCPSADQGSPMSRPDLRGNSCDSDCAVSM